MIYSLHNLIVCSENGVNIIYYNLSYDGYSFGPRVLRGGSSRMVYLGTIYALKKKILSTYSFYCRKKIIYCKVMFSLSWSGQNKNDEFIRHQISGDMSDRIESWEQRHQLLYYCLMLAEHQLVNTFYLQLGKASPRICVDSEVEFHAISCTKLRRN